uniref:FAD/NAD(P)-binding oxidoreductase family protein n=1 Tax=Cucumis melo TaxID=3656 RepID=A0A9I9CIG4_CUCME
MALLPSKLPLTYPNSTLFSSPPRLSSLHLPPFRVSCAKRTGKKRYPSEKKKLKLKHKEVLTTVENKFEGTWRLFKLGVPVEKDPGKDFHGLSDALMQEIAKVLEFPVASLLPREAFSVIRKSFDARKMLKEPKFVYTVDMDVHRLLILEPRARDFISDLEPKVGLMEHFAKEKVSNDVISIVHDLKSNQEVVGANGFNSHSGPYLRMSNGKPKIAVVGSGPSGLFASLVLAEFGADVTLFERGQPVEQRGRDIGALVARRILELDSNFCFGEGGAGTWSDGKLVTRIGRNSGSVQAVMKSLVYFGAPKNILLNGKPHLGTDKLIPLLRNFRQHLETLGVSFYPIPVLGFVTIKFGTRVDDLIEEGGHLTGVKVSDSRDKLKLSKQKLGYDAIVLAVGHSARDVYQMLLSHNIPVIPKEFAYSGLANEVEKGRGKVPVADYKVAKYVNIDTKNPSSNSVAASRSCYSFCMCPGGQVVLTSTNPEELCINGMSFSRRSSKWANAALVVTVSTKDFNDLGFQGPLAGVEFQRELEQRAAVMGGGNFVLPVQTATDFMDRRLRVTSVPPSSYRLGVKASNLHELFPGHITEALQQSILAFDQELPGFLSSDALLHGVETRTSSPIQIPRNLETYESTSVRGLYPVGEGAGYAGGIVSAAVDGMYAGFAVAKSFNLYHGDLETVLGKAQNSGSVICTCTSLIETDFEQTVVGPVTATVELMKNT